MKRLKHIAMLIGTALFFGVLIFIPAKTQAETSGSSGDYTYTVIRKGEVELTAYNGTSAVVSVPEMIGKRKVVRLGDSLFSNHTELAQVTVPDSVTEIGENIFSGCSSLSAVALSNNLPEISPRMFEGCKSLTGIVIPGSVTKIGSFAFCDCSSLKKITLPDSLEDLGEEFTFSGCKSLKTVVIPPKVETIPILAFDSCETLKNVKIPVSVKLIRYAAFFNCLKMENIFYTGSISEWNAVTVGSENSAVRRATVHYAYDPKSTSISKLKSYRKAFLVKWKKQKKKTSGYQIQYGLKSNLNFKSKTVTVSGKNKYYKKITTKKRNRTYYVRVRTYRIINGHTYYSVWSKTKKVKVR